MCRFPALSCFKQFVAALLCMGWAAGSGYGAEPAVTAPPEAPRAATAPVAAAPAVESTKAPAASTAEAKKDSAKTDESSAAKKQTAPASKFIRVRRSEDKQPEALETAIVRFTAKGEKNSGVEVDLIGVVHVGEKSYYEDLNKRFSDYDAVLYELVAAEGQAVPKPGQKRRSANPVGALQMGMKSMLELEFQLDHIDYTKPYMVHADMSPTEFSESMKDRGESFLEMFFRMLGQSMAKQSKDPSANNDLRMLAALFSPNRARQLKQVMAEQFESMDGSISALDGPTGSTIITERNKKAFRVLQEQIKGGKKRIAVFYGAGHLPDMQKRLEADFGLQRAGESWLTAWSLDSKK